MHEITQKDVFLKEATPDSDARVEAEKIAAPRKTLGLRPGPNRMSHEESMKSLFEQYDETMGVLAGIQPQVMDKE